MGSPTSPPASRLGDTVRQLFFLFYQRGARVLRQHGFRLTDHHRAQQIHRLMGRALRPSYVRIGGHRLTLDQLDSLHLSLFGSHEPVAMRFLPSVVRPGDSVIDIGAHIGCYTLLLAKLVGPSGTVVACEPHPENFALLEKNVFENGYENVVLLPKAVSDRTGRGMLQSSPRSSADHSLLAVGGPRIPIEVDTVSLTDLVRTLPERRSLRLIKVDIQGGEPFVLRDIRTVRASNPSLLVMTEYWPYGLCHQGQRPEAYLASLRAQGFGFFLDLDETVGGPVIRSAAEIVARYGPEPTSFTNLLCSPEPFSFSPSGDRVIRTMP